MAMTGAAVRPCGLLTRLSILTVRGESRASFRRWRPRQGPDALNPGGSRCRDRCAGRPRRRPVAAGVPLLKITPSLTMYARSVIRRVSRTLWSVMRTPMPRALRWKMICWMSVTAMGSMPAKGSSSRMKRGDITSARVISGAAPFPARQRVGRRLGQRGQAQFVQERRQPVAALPGRERQRFEDGQQVLLHGEPAEDRGLLRQVADALARPDVHRVVGHVVLVEQHAALVGGHQAHGHVEGRGLAGAVGPEQADDLAGADRRG